MQGTFIGQVEKGQTFSFSVTNRSSSGAAIGGYEPATFDVFDCASGARILMNQVLTPYSTDIDVWFGTIDTSSDDFSSHETYAILVHGTITDTDENPTTAFLYNFRVDPPISGKVDWIRNDVENVLFERFKRLLALSGENLVLDSFGYDASGNITAMRIRLFEDRASAAAASAGITDDEPGEFATYVVTQQHEVPRNVRSSHVSVPETDADDSPATDNQQTDIVNAPGNSGEYPT